MSDAPRPQLRRRVGFVGAAASGVGIVLGAGIYVLIGEAAGRAGDGVWLSFLVAALLAAGTGLSYAELTSMFPEAGAAAAFAEEAFGPRTGFVTGWMDVAVNVIAVPAVAIGFGSYLVALVGVSEPVGAIGVMTISVVVVLGGVTGTVRLAALFAAIEFAGLLFVIAVGLPHLGDVNLFRVHGGATGLLGAAALVFFAYEGFEEVATFSEEVKDPTRNIPRALLVVIVVTTITYLLVAAVAVSVVPWDELATGDAPLARVAAAATSPRVGDALSVVALFATFNTVLLLMATGPRVLYGMARRRLLPPALGRVWRARGTPWVAILVAASVSFAFGVTGDIAFVAEVTNFAIFVLFLIVNGALIRLRIARPDAPRPFRARPSLGPLPVPALVGLTGSLMLAGFMERAAFAAGVAALALGLLASLVFVRPGRVERGPPTG